MGSSLRSVSSGKQSLFSLDWAGISVKITNFKETRDTGKYLWEENSPSCSPLAQGGRRLGAALNGTLTGWAYSGLTSPEDLPYASGMGTKLGGPNGKCRVSLPARKSVLERLY